ncbi:MAG: hypothetical protein ACW963_05345 [Candidatus Sifarchaeia archaeon]
MPKQASNPVERLKAREIMLPSFQNLLQLWNPIHITTYAKPVIHGNYPKST